MLSKGEEETVERRSFDDGQAVTTFFFFSCVGGVAPLVPLCQFLLAKKL